MRKNIEVFKAYKDEDDEEYYCPVADGIHNREAATVAVDDCVEATTAGRYAGNLNVVERFTQ